MPSGSNPHALSTAHRSEGTLADHGTSSVHAPTAGVAAGCSGERAWHGAGRVTAGLARCAPAAGQTHRAGSWCARRRRHSPTDACGTSCLQSRDTCSSAGPGISPRGWVAQPLGARVGSPTKAAGKSITPRPTELTTAHPALAQRTSGSGAPAVVSARSRRHSSELFNDPCNCLANGGRVGKRSRASRSPHGWRQDATRATAAARHANDARPLRAAGPDLHGPGSMMRASVMRGRSASAWARRGAARKRNLKRERRWPSRRWASWVGECDPRLAFVHVRACAVWVR